MTPYEIELLLRFHYRAIPMEGFTDSPLLYKTLGKFEKLKLITLDDICHYKAGPALACYVDAICSIPAPENVWQIHKNSITVALPEHGSIRG